MIGATVCARGFSGRPPSTLRVLLPMPLDRRTQRHEKTAGPGRAAPTPALRRTVVPVAPHAAMRAFSVPVTLGSSRKDVGALELAPRACRCSPTLTRRRAAPTRGKVGIDAARPMTFAAGWRQGDTAEAGQHRSRQQIEARFPCRAADRAAVARRRSCRSPRVFALPLLPSRRRPGAAPTASRRHEYGEYVSMRHGPGRRGVSPRGNRKGPRSCCRRGGSLARGGDLRDTGSERWA